MSALRQVFALGWNDLRLTLKDRQAFIWLLLMPVGMMWIFGLAFNMGDGEEPRVYLCLDDRGSGWLGTALIAELDADQIDIRDLQAEPIEGDWQPPWTLVLPSGMTEKVLAGESVEVRLEVDPEANQQFEMSAEFAIRRALVRVTGRLLASELSPKEDGDVEADDVVSVAAVEARYEELAAEAPLVTLDVSRAGRGRPVPTGFAQSVPGVLTAIVLMMTLIYGGIFLITEKNAGMLRRQLSLPIPRLAVIVGKIFGRLLIASAQIVVLLTISVFAFGIDLGNSPAGLLLLIMSYALAAASLTTLVGAFLTTTEQVSTVGWLLAMALGFLGGCWWPFEVMPPWLQTIAHGVPTTWAMKGFHSLISYGYGIESVLMPSLALLGFSAVFAALAIRLLRDH